MVLVPIWLSDMDILDTLLQWVQTNQTGTVSQHYPHVKKAFWQRLIDAQGYIVHQCEMPSSVTKQRWHLTTEDENWFEIDYKRKLNYKEQSWQQCVLTLGIIGGVNVPFFKPSQLKPSNHLKEKHHHLVISYLCFTAQLHCGEKLTNSSIFIHL